MPIKAQTMENIKQKIKLSIAVLMLVIGCCFPYGKILAASVSVHVPEKYTDVKAGERLYFEIEVKYPENNTRKDLRIEYQILKDDNLIATSKVLKAIETQASFMDYIVIPESTKKGMHEILVNVEDYNDLNIQASSSFYVTEKDSELKIYFYIIVGFIIILGIIVIWQINRLRKILK
jgi:hypothetical protein